jgi:hypothetical protein
VSEVVSEVWSEVDNEVWREVENEVWKEARNEVWSEVGNEVEGEVWSKVVKEVWDEVKSEVWNEFDNEVWDEVWSEVDNEVWKEVRDEVGDEVRGELSKGLKNIVFPYLYGSFDVWYSFYDFFNQEVFRLKESEKFNIVKNMSKLGFVWTCKDFCVISQKPSKIKKNNKGLHADGETALEYAGLLGTKMYYLNGVKVPEYLAMTPEGELDIEFFKREKNADVKAEFVRKYGVERMLSLGTKIDSYENYTNEWYTKSEYELWDMKAIFEGLDYVPYLKMKNQTTGIWHVECVDPSCRTIDDAIKYRFNGKNLDIINIK